MRRPHPESEELVLTQAEEVPPPEPSASPAEEVDPQLLEEVEGLAQRAGGLTRLRDLVDALIRTPR